jgi:aspartate carbamoyltransferase
MPQEENMILQENNFNSSPHLPFGDQRTAPWYGKSILSVKQFSIKDLKYIFEVAHEMREMVERVGTFDLLKGKILANLFYEPSTRTASSFTAAMERLGGSVIPINEVKYSSVAKGESLPDTIRSLECYSDVIVLRHPEVGASALAAQYAHKPIINAGDGIGEHPTQALLDLFTIIEEKGQVDGLSVTLLGDLKYGRTVHSLSRLLSLYDVRLNFVSPEILSLPREIMKELTEKGIPCQEFSLLEEILPKTDVLYVTRVQKERFEDVKEYEKVKGTYIITPETLEAAKKDMVVMHPLPRVGEISMELDDDPRAAYFRQMEYGMYVRMALLAMVLGKA